MKITKRITSNLLTKEQKCCIITLKREIAWQLENRIATTGFNTNNPALPTKLD